MGSANDVLLTEQEVIGSLFVDQSLVPHVFEKLVPKDFEEMHQYILQAIREILYEESCMYDHVSVTTVWAIIKQHNWNRKVKKSYLRELATNVVSSSEFEDHVKMLADMHMRAFLEEEMVHVRRGVAKHDAIVDLLSGLDHIRNEIGDRLHRINPPLTPKDHVDRIRREVKRAMEMPGEITGIPTGFQRVDLQTGGLQPELIIIAGRTSMGKTAFALDICHNNMKFYRHKAAFFSYEMPSHQLFLRMACKEANMSMLDVRRGRLGESGYERLNKVLTSYEDLNFFVDDNVYPITQLISRIETVVRQEGVEFVVIDYLQLIPYDGDSRGRSRQDEVAEISRSLKALQKRLEIPIIPIAQLSRETTRRGSREPRLEDLRESGALEQDADVVFFIHRPFYYGEKERAGRSLEDVAEIIIGKQRNGPTGKVEIIWAEGHFENPATKEWKHKEL